MRASRCCWRSSRRSHVCFPDAAQGKSTPWSRFTMNRLWRRITGRADRDLDREIRGHLDLEAEELGRDSARRAFGNPTLIKEDTRAMWGWTSIEHAAQDV